VFPGYDHDMDRGLRVNIPESDDGIVLVDDVGRDLSSGDPAKDTLTAHDGIIITLARIFSMEICVASDQRPIL